MSLTPFFGMRAVHDPIFGLGAPSATVAARESATALLVEVDCPRFTADQIQVDCDDKSGKITITGNRPARADVFEHFLFGASEATAFSRSFYISPRAYDLGKMTKEVVHGVLRLTFPKVQQPPAIEAKPVTLFDGAEQQHTTSTAVAKATAPSHTVSETQMQALTHELQADGGRMQSKLDESADSYTYTITIPAAVQKNCIKIDLNGRALVLTVQCDSGSEEKKAAEEGKPQSFFSRHSSVTYSQSYGVPEGTQPEQIHTHYEPGTVTIKIDKKPEQASQEQHIAVSSPLLKQ